MQNFNFFIIYHVLSCFIMLKLLQLFKLTWKSGLKSLIKWLLYILHLQLEVTVKHITNSWNPWKGKSLDFNLSKFSWINFNCDTVKSSVTLRFKFNLSNLRLRINLKNCPSQDWSSFKINLQKCPLTKILVLRDKPKSFSQKTAEDNNFSIHDTQISQINLKKMPQDLC